MSAVERYLEDLSRALHVRGRARRRLLAECRDHLDDSAADLGEDEAVHRFGDAGALARDFDLEVAVRRGRHAVLAALVGVLAVGGSTLALVDAADPRQPAVVAWAVVFFAAAQAAAVCLVLAVVRTVAVRRRAASSRDVVLIVRRSVAALGLAALTLVAAGGAVPGEAPASLVLGGPLVAVVAAVVVLRARRLARRLPAAPPARGVPAVLVAASIVVATLGAFAWDRLDHGSPGQAVTDAGVEAALVVLGFVLLGPALGLWSGRSRYASDTRSA